MSSSTVSDSCGESSGGHGISALTVANSSGSTFGSSISDHGINASRTVQNSYGFSAGGDGIHSGGTVASSYGHTYGADASADGIQAYLAVGCFAGGGENIDNKYLMP